jgi:GNAT superfamily N-acetyltransferase
MITCRRAIREDVALFREIRLRALRESPDAYGSTYESALQRDQGSWEEQLWSTVSGLLRNTQFAFHGDECIGIAALYREPGSEWGDVIMMWVDPRHRGSDAATLLVGNLLEWARECGLRSVGLGVTDANARAIRFYEKMGFVATGETLDVDAERGLRGIRMERPLCESDECEVASAK